MNAPFSAVFRTLNGTAASLSALHETLRRIKRRPAPRCA